MNPIKNLVNLVVQIDEDLKRRVKIQAATRDISVRDFVIEALQAYLVQIGAK